MTTETPFGTLKYDLAKPMVIVGDRAVPPLLEVEFQGVDGQPAFEGRIEVISGVPRWTDVRVYRVPDGREVKQKDLRAIRLDDWLESFITVMSFKVTERNGGKWAAVSSDTDVDIREGMRSISRSRRGERRRITGVLKARIAEIYEAHDSGGIEAVATAFNVSKSTAIRYINEATADGLITSRPRQSTGQKRREA
ncbi:hypothetical protein [Demequina lutea]|uniref:Uncharacterized protein n=1 Tax=Demequina lutea TaxID=431489 RepID=A0A7Z0CHI0_9MICO|nr:hypothetical protein [Demequina lutea]NYI41506.1 hypothetical protein [Demequina lutea]